MTSDDTLSVAAAVYKHLTLLAASRQQAFAVLQIVNTLFVQDDLNDSKKPEQTS